MARIVTVYRTSAGHSRPVDMSYVRWLKMSEALAALGTRSTSPPASRAACARRRQTAAGAFGETLAATSWHGAATPARAARARALARLRRGQDALPHRLRDAGAARRRRPSVHRREARLGRGSRGPAGRLLLRRPPPRALRRAGADRGTEPLRHHTDRAVPRAVAGMRRDDGTLLLVPGAVDAELAGAGADPYRSAGGRAVSSRATSTIRGPARGARDARRQAERARACSRRAASGSASWVRGA